MNITITLYESNNTIRKVVVMEFNEYIKMVRCISNSISDHRIDAHIDAIEKYISDLNVSKTVEKLLA